MALVFGCHGASSPQAPMADARTEPAGAAAEATADRLPSPAPHVFTLEEDIAVLATEDAWLVRETFLGWSTARGAITRRVLCDRRGKGDGANCELSICRAGERSGCSSVLSLYHLDADQTSRRRFDPAKAARIAEQALAAEGPLTTAGPPAPTIRLELAAGVLTLVAPRFPARELARIDPTRERVTSAELTSAATTDDSDCLLALGHYRVAPARATGDDGELRRIAELWCRRDGPVLRRETPPPRAP